MLGLLSIAGADAISLLSVLQNQQREGAVP
jgi:hypothetical protein